MAAIIRTPTQRLIDLAWLETAYVRGCVSARKLLEKFNLLGRPYTITVRTIENDLIKLRQRFEEELNRMRPNMLAQQIRKLREIEDELWDSWLISKKEQVESSLRKKTGADGSTAAGTESSVKKKSAAGDAQFMRLIIEVQEQIAKLVGLNAPIKTEASGPDGGPIKTEATNLNLTAAIPAELMTNERALEIMRRFTEATTPTTPTPDVPTT